MYMYVVCMYKHIYILAADCVYDCNQANMYVFCNCGRSPCSQNVYKLFVKKTAEKLSVYVH